MSLAFATEKELVDHLQIEDMAVVNILGGIVFDSEFGQGATVPKSITYKIR